MELAKTLIFGWLEERTIWRVEWRCASRDSGGQCVVSPGIGEMRVLPADNLVSPQNVSYPLLENVLCWCQTPISSLVVFHKHGCHFSYTGRLASITATKLLLVLH